MSDSAPRIVYPVLAPAALSAWFIVDGLFLTPRLLGAVLAVGGTLLGLRTLRDLSTRVTPEGVTQLTWRGRLHLRWIDITGVARQPRALIVSGTAGRIVVPIELFNDTNDTVRYIYARLPPNLNVPLEALLPGNG